MFFIKKIVKIETAPCAYPENFVRGGPDLITFSFLFFS